MDKLLRIGDVTELLSVSRSKVYDLIESGDLPVVRLGSKPKSGMRFRPADIEAFIERMASGVPA